MAHCFVIGIGGTGARCVEAFLHLCAAGLGPAQVTLGFIDQDGSNGNVARAIELAKKLTDTKKSLGANSKNRLASDFSLFRTSIDLIGTDGYWCPLDGQKPSIDKAFGYDKGMPQDLKPLFEALFSERERQLPLDEGYRGVPSIGAAVLAGRAMASDPFWGDLANRMQQGTTTGGGARLFVFGSIFGGTGAAGFPTLPRVVRGSAQLKGATNLEISGALMLPYFYYKEPSIKDAKRRAYSSAFMIQTEAALQYYNRLLSTNSIYDELYLLGWNPVISLPYLSDGGKGQENPAMVPEMYAALAAARFLRGGVGRKGAFHTIGIKDRAEVTWSDIPSINQGGNLPKTSRLEVSMALSQLLRFCFAFRRVFLPCLLKETWQQYADEEWLRRRLIDAGVDLNDPAVEMALSDIDAYAEEHLKWTAMMAAMGAGGESTPLYNYQHYASYQEGAEGRRPAIVLHDELESGDEHRTQEDRRTLPPSRRTERLDDEHRRGFANLTTSGGTTTLATVLSRLTYSVPTRTHQRLGRFVGDLYTACA